MTVDKWQQQTSLAFLYFNFRTDTIGEGGIAENA